jgi:hypothetical protein
MAISTPGYLFRSFFQGGFECSTHRLRSGTRLDLIRSTGHDLFALQDYKRLAAMGMRTARDGARWHLIERSPYEYDFSSILPMIRAARATGIQIIWDICHYGWPDDLDIFSEEFIYRFSSFAGAFAKLLAAETDEIPCLSPINEISFFAWGAGDEAILNPFATGRGNELKAHLVRATVAAIDEIRSHCPDSRFVQVDPIINIVLEPEMGDCERREIEGYLRAQYAAWDMVCGGLHPELGGGPEYLDVIGVNYYVHNQWAYKGKFIERTDPRYRPLEDLLAEVYRRYERPILIAETGIEDDRRAEWLSYVCDEIAAALKKGIPIEGLCLYPILNHPGWEDERHCHNGLWDYCNESGHREIYSPLAEEIMRQQARIDRVRSAIASRQETVSVSA